MIGFGLLDWLVLIAFFAGLTGLVIWVVLQEEKDTADYFLAGRSVGWFAVGAAIFASNIGSEHLVGLAGAGYDSGMAMAHWEIQGWLLLVLAWVFVPFYERSRVFTMPEFLEKRYDSRSRTFLSFISLVSYVLTKVAVTVYAGGVVLQTVLGIRTWMGIDFFWISAISLVVITGLFTVFGGMRAVLYVAMVKTPILLLGSVAIVIIGLNKVGGWGEVERIVGPNLHLIRPASDPNFPWTGVLFGSAIIGFWYWCTDQYIVQRTLSARNETQARRGAIFAAYLKLTPVFIFMIPGMIAYTMVQKGLLKLEAGDQAFPTLVATLLPAGFRGVMVAALVVALMGSLASLFNSSATLFTMDFYKKLRPNSSERHLVKVGRIATATIVVLGIIWIPVMRLVANVLYEYLQNVQSLIAPSIAVVFLLGISSKRITPAAGYWGLVAGFVLGMGRLALVIFRDRLPEGGLLARFVAVNWLHFCILLFFFTVILMLVISYFTKPKPAQEIVGLTITGCTPEQRAASRASWNYWDVIHSTIVVAVVVWFYIRFW